MTRGGESSIAAEPTGMAERAFRAVDSVRPILSLAGGLFLVGCASFLETDPHARYSDTERTLYGATGAAGTSARFDEHSTLDDYLRHAFSHSPELRAAFDRWKAALERIPQARALDDPTLSFEYFIEQMDTRYQASLTQTFPAFGKLELREKRAVAEADAARHAFEAARLTLFDRVVKAFHEYHYLSRAIQVTDDTHQLLADLEQVVTSRYKASLAPFSELVKIQVEKDRLANARDTWRDARASRSAGLAALLALPVHDVLPWPRHSPAGPVVVDLKSLDGMIEDLNPELKAAASMIDAETWREKLAGRSLLPDFLLGASWMVMRGMEGDETDLGIMVGVTIPLWRGKYRAQAREAAAMARAATHARDERRNMLRAELSLAVFKWRDAERRVGLFAGTLIPKAAQALEVAKQEFSAGKSDFMTLIDAERTWMEFRLGLERATVDREIALGEIGCCIGRYDVEAALKEGARQ